MNPEIITGNPSVTLEVKFLCVDQKEIISGMTGQGQVSVWSCIP